MDSGTPYNSIYEAVGSGKNSKRSSLEEEELVCCSHGAKCEISHQETGVVVNMDDPDEEGQYLNLVDQANKKRNDQLNSMREQLENLGMGKNPRQKEKGRKETTSRLVEMGIEKATGAIPPYNSIYEAIACGNKKKYSGEEEEMVCCAHGRQGCAISKQEEESDMNRDELLNSMKKQLEDLELGQNPRQKKAKKKKSKESSQLTKKEEIEDEVFPRKPIRVVQLTNSERKKTERKKSSNTDSKSENKTKEVMGLESELLFETYLGAMTFEEAEQMVKKKTDFRLYHRLDRPHSVDYLEEHSLLHFVYRTIHGDFRHFPIRKRRECGERIFYVDYGNPRAEGHPTLEELIDFYKSNSRMHKQFVDIGHAK